MWRNHITKDGGKTKRKEETLIQDKKTVETCTTDLGLRW